MRAFPESDFQKSFVQHLEQRLVAPWFYFAVANQKGTRKTWEQQLLKALGVKPGIPDLFIIGPGPTIIGIECKAPPKRLESGALSRAEPRVSPAQRQMALHFDRCDCAYIVVNDLDLGLVALSALGAPIVGVPNELSKARMRTLVS